MASFRHRGYLGWITDLATSPDSEAAWPSMRLDDALLRDYREAFRVLERLGFNEVSIWGLYVSRAWPVDIRSAVTPERAARVEKLIDAAHRRGLKVLAGLGVYSWGFEEILRAHPRAGRGSGQAMCASEPLAWEWMRKVLDFVFTRFPIDGVSMQSADQGRCPCEECRRYTDAEYHALLNLRVAGYVRDRWPGRTLGVNSWGMDFGDPAGQPALVRMSRQVDYLIDVHDSSRRRDPGYRRTLASALACDFGTLGGPQVEPPQHWPRDRWLVPTPKRVAEHLQDLARDGGRACELFFHILANPGDEVTLWVAGRVLSDPAAPWQRHLEEAVEELYGTARPSLRDALAGLFLSAEEAYFRHQPGTRCGTFSLEPLVGDRPGPPLYLSQALSKEQRAAYRADLQALSVEARTLLPEVPRRERMARVLRCLEGALRDLDRLAAGPPEGTSPRHAEGHGPGR